MSLRSVRRLDSLAGKRWAPRDVFAGFTGRSLLECAPVKISQLLPLLLAAALVSCADVQERSRIVGARTGTQLTRRLAILCFESLVKKSAQYSWEI